MRSDVRANRERIGGVLLNVEDVCYWKDFDVFDNGWDTFKGDFVVRELEIEENDARVVDRLSATERASVNQQPRNIRVLFIYEDHTLQGAAGTLRFWHT